MQSKSYLICFVKMSLRFEENESSDLLSQLVKRHMSSLFGMLGKVIRSTVCDANMIFVSGTMGSANVKKCL